MSADITIQPMAPGEFGVQVKEGQVEDATSHVVRVTDGFLDDLGLGHIDQEQVVRESFLRFA